MASTTASEPVGARRRGRRQAAPGAAGFAQKPFRQPVRRWPPVELISADELETLHEASLRVLAEVGMEVLDNQARQIMRAAGALVRAGERRVRFDPDLIMAKVATIPASFTLHARNPAHNVQLGGDRLVFNLMGSAPNCADADTGRRPGTQADFRNFLKLGQMHNILHVTGGYPVEPLDVHPRVRHLACVHDFVTLTDKAYGIYTLGNDRTRDALEMTRIAHGLSVDAFRHQPSVFTIINTNSPLTLDIPMAQGIIDMAAMGQPVVITPFTLAGAMAPITLAGALVQQNAEALVGLALSQMVNPGAPAVYGGFTSNVDMKSGAPAFGTPEYVKAQHVGGQLARRYNVPYRSSNVCAANTVDAQAAYESVLSLWGAVNGGAHMFKHGAGWMEGGLCCSYEKIMLDIDLLQMVDALLEPLAFDVDALAEAAIRDVGPGGHFFGADHTQARYRDAFYAPILSDWRNYETWREAGAPTAMVKANRVWQERLAQYAPPPLDDAIAEALADFVARREAEGGAATDF